MNEAMPQSTMVATTRVTVPPESRKEFFQTITPLTQRIRRESGCLDFRVYAETGDENSIVVIEEWAAEANWAAHRKGENFAVVFGLLRVLGVPSKMSFKLLTPVSERMPMSG